MIPIFESRPNSPPPTLPPVVKEWKPVIGASYRYPGSDRVFILTEIRRFSFVFECGHWCTDNVFADLIRVPTSSGLGSFQLSLFDQGVTNGNQ